MCARVAFTHRSYFAGERFSGDLVVANVGHTTVHWDHGYYRYVAGQKNCEILTAVCSVCLCMWELAIS